MKALSLALILTATGVAHAQTTLVGGSINNGDFNDNSLSVAAGTRTYANTLFWTKLDGGTFVDATTDVLIGSLASRNLNVRRQAALSIAAGNTGHTISTGDVFDVAYQWVDGSGWSDANDQISIRLFTTSDNTINGTISYIATTNSGVKGGNSAPSSQYVDQDGFYTATISDAGKTLFVAITSTGTTTNAFARVDDFVLEVTQSLEDPALNVDAGDFKFGELFHATGSSSTSRTVTFRNTGATQDLTLDAISLTNNAGGVYTITSAPSGGTVISPGDTFDVEITATGGGGSTDFLGVLLIDTTPNDQDTSFSISAGVSTTGDDFSNVTNPRFNDGISGWTGDAVATSGLNSVHGARVRGVGDDRSAPTAVYADNLGQVFSYQDSPDFNVRVSFAIPDFASFVGLAPSAAFYDRSFHLAIQAAPSVPGSGDFVDATAANTIINLFYLADGIPGDTGAGFFLWDGTLNAGAGGFSRLASLGTLLPSTGFNPDGTSPTSLNTYQLIVAGSGFGTGAASYDISISNPNSTTIGATASGLSVYHGADPKTHLAKAVVLTTSDSPTLSVTNPATAYQPSFWVDAVNVTLDATLPVALYELTTSPKLIKVAGNQTETTSFTISNIGLADDLSVSSAVFGDPRFTLLSPALPVDIAPGNSLEFTVRADMSATSGDEAVSTTLALVTNDGVVPNRSINLQADVVKGGRRILVDFDDGLANGIHETSIRNGGFEDGAAGDSFLTTPSWMSRFSPEGDAVQLTYDTAPASGTRHGVAGGFSGSGADRAQPVEAISLADWTLQEGDTFDISLAWRDGANFAQGNTMQVVVEVIDANGNPIFDPVNQDGGTADRFSTTGLVLAEPGTYQTDTFKTRAVPAGSPWIGGRPRIRFLNDAARTTFLNLDNVSVVGNLFAEPGGELTLTSFGYDPVTKYVTLRWTDAGFSSYTIQSDADLDFSTGVTTYTYPDDGTADTITYPGEIEFIFNDPTATGSKNFWRVIGE